jgi:hypothetical protein
MVSVSVRLFIRLGTPHYERGDIDKMPWVVRVWETLPILYDWDMLAINYAACAIGYALLLCCYTLSQRGDGIVLQRERACLLG